MSYTNFLISASSVKANVSAKVLIKKSSEEKRTHQKAINALMDSRSGGFASPEFLNIFDTVKPKQSVEWEIIKEGVALRENANKRLATLPKLQQYFKALEIQNQDPDYQAFVAERKEKGKVPHAKFKYALPKNFKELKEVHEKWKLETTEKMVKQNWVNQVKFDNLPQNMLHDLQHGYGNLGFTETAKDYVVLSVNGTIEGINTMLYRLQEFCEKQKAMGKPAWNVSIILKATNSDKLHYEQTAFSLFDTSVLDEIVKMQARMVVTSGLVSSKQTDKIQEFLTTFGQQNFNAMESILGINLVDDKQLLSEHKKDIKVTKVIEWIETHKQLELLKKMSQLDKTKFKSIKRLLATVKWDSATEEEIDKMSMLLNTSKEVMGIVNQFQSISDMEKTIEQLRMQLKTIDFMSE